MTEFLINHFRYDTMNSWNSSTSYANNVKLHKLGLPNEIEKKAYDLLETEECRDELQLLLNDWGRSYEYRWQVGFNGRSAGYLVLYTGGTRNSGYKSYCIKCGQRNYKKAPPANPTQEEHIGLQEYTLDNRCGRCGSYARVNYEKEPVQTYTNPGINIDMCEDFFDWDMNALRERVKLVQDFDLLCDNLLANLVEMCEQYDVVEKEIFVPTKIKILKEVS